MTVLKRQLWRPDTHPGHVVEVEWEFDPHTGRDTGRAHRAISIRYPDGRHIHRDTHSPDDVDKDFKALCSENETKNRAYGVILDRLPAHMKKPVLDSDGDAQLDSDGRTLWIVKDKHKPRFKHLGGGGYEFGVPGIDDAMHGVVSAALNQEFGERVKLLKSAS